MKTMTVIAKNKRQNATEKKKKKKKKKRKKKEIKDIFSVLFLVFEDNGFITHDQRPIPTLFSAFFRLLVLLCLFGIRRCNIPIQLFRSHYLRHAGVLLVLFLFVDFPPTLLFISFLFSFYILYYGLGLGLARAIGREGAFGCLYYYLFFFVSTWFMTFVIVIRIFDYCGFQPCICIRALFFKV